MESEEYAGVEPRTLSQLYRRNRLSAVSVGRGTLNPDSFRYRNSVLFRATTSIQRSLFFGVADLCFLIPLRAIVPIAPAPVGPPRAADSERQATLPELIPHYLGY